MPYLYKRIKTKHRDFVTRTKCFYYNPAAAKKPRGIRMCSTGETKKQRNRHNAYLKNKYLMYNNFDKGDWWLTLTNRSETEPQTAHKKLTNMIGRLHKKLKRMGIQLIYYAKTEAGENIRAHHHLLIKNTSPLIVGMILEYWQQYGNVKDVKQIYNIENGRLITYILDGGDHKELNFEKYSHSRNLAEPEIEKRIYPFESFRERPKPPKAEDGYRYEIKNLYNGFPSGDGFIYQEYELVKIKEVFEE